jgi:hypothetical protein
MPPVMTAPAQIIFHPMVNEMGGYGVWYNKARFMNQDRRYVISVDTNHECDKKFMNFEKYDDMVEFMASSIPGNMYEVYVSLDDPCWCYFDLDRPDSKYTTLDVLTNFLPTLRACLEEEHGVSLDWKEGTTYQVAEASTTAKTSMHLIVRIKFGNGWAMKTFGHAVAARLLDIGDKTQVFMCPKKGAMKSIVDLSVYSQFRSFRPLGMAKYGKPNLMAAMGNSSTCMSDHFIRFYEGFSAQPIHEVGGSLQFQSPRSVKISREKNTHDAHDAYLCKAYSDFINGYDCLIEKLGGNKVDVRRVETKSDTIAVCSLSKFTLPICPYAGRCHKRNNLYLVVDRASKCITIKCHDEDCAGKHDHSYIMRDMDVHRTEVHDINNYDTLHSQENNISWSEVYCEPSMRPYPIKPIVCVRAGMGTGKTRAMLRLVEDHFDPRTKALLVTFSQTLASKLSKDFAHKGFVSYKDVEGPINDCKIVVCLDSLYRVKTCNFDYVFVDEAVSVFLHFNSSLMTKSSTNSALLELLITQSKSTFFIDACMDHTFSKKVVDYFSTKKMVTPHWIHNKYVRPSNRQAIVDIVNGKGANSVTVHSQMVCAVNRVLTMLQDNLKVVVCSSTKRFTTVLEEFIRKRRPETKMLVYNSSMTNTLDDVDEHWTSCELLVYSPSITAGVSFEKGHFDCLVAFLTNSSYAPTVDITLQQMFRVRCLLDGRMYLYIQEQTRDPLPQSEADIEAFLDDDVSLASKYFVDYKMFYSAQHKITGGGMEYDKDRLSYLIIKGIVMMRNRSTMNYTSILMGTLETDYDIKCSPMQDGTPKMTEVDMELLREAADIKEIPDYDMVVSEAGEHLEPVQKAASRLFEFQELKWKIQTVDRHFYENMVMASSADETYRKALRFNQMCENTLDANRRLYVKNMDIIANDIDDPNMEVYKSKKKSYYLKVIIGQQVLELVTDKNMLRRLESTHVHEDAAVEAIRVVCKDMTSPELTYFNRLYDLKPNQNGYTMLKKILGSSFDIDVSRRDRKCKRPAFKTLVLTNNVMKDMVTRYGNVMGNTTAGGCMFR